MRARALLGAIAATILAITSSLITAIPAHAEPAASDTIIVTLDHPQTDPGRTVQQAVADAADKIAGAEIMNVAPISPTTVAVTVDQPLTRTEQTRITDRVEDQAGIKAADPAAVFQPNADSPADSYWPSEWGMVGDHGVQAQAAWDDSTGNTAVVGVIDTGITAHPDLDSNRVAGYDFITDPARAGDGDGRDPDPTDTGASGTYHGTHVAGTIAAANDGQGVVGVAPDAKIEPLRVLGAGGGIESDILPAMRWAAGLAVPGMPTNPNPVDVINMSLGGAGPCSTATQATINDILAKGVPIVVSAGNDTAAIDGQQPANCQGVIRVVATDSSGKLATFSNYGSAAFPATIAGPGVSVISDYSNGGYIYMSGTSMAAPHVSGTVALLKGIDHTLTPVQITQLLTATTRPLSQACAAEVCGAGIVDAAAAIAAKAPASSDTQPIATIAGSAAYGQTLTATVDPSRTVRSYAWLRDSQRIDEANSSTYTLTAADVGHQVSIQVGTTWLNQWVSRVSAPVTVQLATLTQTGMPTIAGSPISDQTLTAAATVWAENPSVAVQWLRDGQPIDGATGCTWRLTSADAGHQLAVRATATLASYATATVDSDPVTVQPGVIVNTRPPTVTGTPKVGNTLTGNTGAWSPAASVARQWLRDGQPIAGAIGSSYTAAAADAGHRITFQVAASRPGYTTSTAATDPVEVVAGAITSRGALTVTGTPAVGQTVTAKPPSFSPTPTIAGQWLRDGATISGATNTRYVATVTDLGHQIAYRVTATRAGYATVTLQSDPAAIGLGTIAIRGTATIAGTPQVGKTLTGRNPGFSVSPTLAVQWLRDGAVVDGATRSSYPLTAADLGHQLAYQVTATRDGYTSVVQTSLPITIQPGILRASGAFTISGTRAAGKTLTARMPTFTPAATLTVQWLRDNQPIDGATSGSYTLTATDRQHAISVQITGTVAGYTDLTVTSSAVPVA